jgi:hypothetical protein
MNQDKYFNLQDNLYVALLEYREKSGINFSVRKKFLKDSENNIFTGTQKSGYISFSLWEIPMWYAGASVDLLTLQIMEQSGRLRVLLQGLQTRDPEDEQNEVCLILIQVIREKLQHLASEDKSFSFWGNEPDSKYETIHFDINIEEGDDLIQKMIKLTSVVQPIIDAEIDVLKQKHPDWICNRITDKRFEEWNMKMLKKRKEYADSQLELSNRTEVDFSATGDEMQDTQTSIQSGAKVGAQLNQILFGPPGTGKTYNTIYYALSIIEQKSIEDLQIEGENDEGRKKLVERFNRYKENNVASMITFHQSFAYEDFIEGIKPTMEEESIESGGKDLIQYQIVDGIFKQLCIDARAINQIDSTSNIDVYIAPEILENKSFHKISLGNTLDDSGNSVYSYCKENNCIALGWGEDVDYSGVDSRKGIKDCFLAAGYAAQQRDFNIGAIERFILWMKEGDIVFISHGNQNLKAVGIIEGGYEYRASKDLPFLGYNHFRKVKWLIKDALIPVKQVYYANFSQQTIYSLWSDKIKKDFFTQKKKKEIARNHVLIIDEINRGNVSSIFGELISLIEEDKREGKTNALSAVLPYSKKEFSVPSNVYIIGTMNTADRSVEALDTALRRRFSFVEMLPQPELLKDRGENNSGKVGEIDLVHLLTTINERIEALVDRDHTIGHAFFMEVDSIDSLRNVFANKVIPLLQEYFYGDYAKMEMVIGPDFFNQEKRTKKVVFAVQNEDFEIPNGNYELRDILDSTFNFESAINRLLNRKVIEFEAN